MAKGIVPKIISDTILEIPGSPVIVVGLCELDGEQYAAFVNTWEYDQLSEVYRGYINKIYLNMTKEVFKNNYVIYDDEEWTVISSFFDKSGVFEMNRIERWIWSKVNGVPLIPKWMYADADKKRRKVVGMQRKKLILDPVSKEETLTIKWNSNESNPSAKNKTA